MHGYRHFHVMFVRGDRGKDAPSRGHVVEILERAGFVAGSDVAVSQVAHNPSRMAAVAGDLWNVLENLRPTWEHGPQAMQAEEVIAAYERLTGLRKDGDA